MKDSSTRIGIVAVALAVIFALGVAAVFLTRASDPEPTAAVTAASVNIDVVDIDGAYDPVAAGDQLPEGYRQLLGRDQIEPVYDPVFTTADQVDWPLEMLVIGVSSSDTAKAYPITHLNQHEMVIDHLDGSPILVSW